MTTANIDRVRLFGSPKSSIKVSNLMSNGLSYPTAKKILRKSLIKQPGYSGTYNLSLGQQDSIISGDVNVTANVHFSDYPSGKMMTDSVQLPKISTMDGLYHGQASITKKVDEGRVRQDSMKYYTTFIRKVNEFHVNSTMKRRAAYPVLKPEPTQWQKYKKYMNMLEEDDGSFPRVSELSLRLEQDRLMKESKNRL